MEVKPLEHLADTHNFCAYDDSAICLPSNSFQETFSATVDTSDVVPDHLSLKIKEYPELIVKPLEHLAVPEHVCSNDDSAICIPANSFQETFSAPIGDPKTVSGSRQLKVDWKIVVGLRAKVTKLKRQLFVARQTSLRRLKALMSKNKQIAALKKHLQVLEKRKKGNEKLGEQARENPIIFDSLRNASRAPKGRRYHPQTMKFAASTYLSGPRTYRHIRRSSHLVLPHKNSVYNHNKTIRIEPGLNRTILSRVKERTKNVEDDKNKTVVLSFDGMSIKSELSYSAKADKFYGFPDHGIRRKVEKNDTSKLATEAVTVMVSGIYWRFKQVTRFPSINKISQFPSCSQKPFSVLESLGAFTSVCCMGHHDPRKGREFRSQATVPLLNVD